MRVSVAVVAILVAAAPPGILSDNATCSLQEMEDPKTRCSCVQRGYGSEEDKAQCLGGDSVEDKQNSTEGRAVALAGHLLPSEDGVNGSREKRSPVRVQPLYYQKSCVTATRDDRSAFITNTICKPQTTFMIQCNKCMCASSGMSAACTKRQCSRELQSGCEPGTVKMVECNSCICAAEGSWACTRKECVSDVEEVDCRQLSSQASLRGAIGRGCSPGTSFKIGCDRCFCSEDGVSAVCRSLPCNGVKGRVVLLHELAGGDNEELEIGKPDGEGQPGVATETGDEGERKRGPGSVWGAGVQSDPWGLGLKGRSSIVSEPQDEGTGRLGGDGLWGAGESGGLWEAAAGGGGVPVGAWGARSGGGIGGGGVGGVGGAPGVLSNPSSAGSRSTVGGLRVLSNRGILMWAESNCSSGVVVYRDCFVCYCLGDGDLALCIDQECEPTVRESGPLRKFLEVHPQKLDVPLTYRQDECNTSLTVFKDSCNFCTCGENGKTGVCTAWPCPYSIKASNPAVRVRDSPQHCQPYTTHMKACNSCFCNQNGTNAVCTRSDCKATIKAV